MTTVSAPRPPAPPARPAPPLGAAGPQGVAPIDPIKLLKQHAALLLICVMVGTGLGVAAHFTLARVWPIYKATVVYDCRPPEDSLVKPTNTYNTDELDRYMQTQAAMMTSDTVFQATARDTYVQQTTWAKRFYNSKGEYQWRDAALALDDRLKARVRPMTNLIELTCTWKNPADCATIVNAANRAYLDDSRTYAQRVDNERRQVLSKRLLDIKNQIDDLVKRRQRLIEERKITSDTTHTSDLLLNIQSLQTERTTLLGRASAQQQLVANYEAQISGQGRIDYPDRIREAALADPIVREMDRDLADLASRRQAMLKQGIQGRHPDMIAVNALIESKRSERDSTFEATMDKLFRGDLDSMRNALKANQASLDELDRKIDTMRAQLRDLLAATHNSDQIKSQIERLEQDQTDTENALRQLDAMSALKESSRIRVMRQGQTPDDMTFPRLVILAPAGAVLLPMLVAGFLFLREVFDQRVRGPADLSLIPRLRVLGVIPDAAEDPARPAAVATAFRDSPSSAVTESFRQLRAPLAKRMEQAGHRTLLVIPGMPGSGGTSVVCNLAIGNAFAEKRVLVIDANFRRPGVHKVFALAEGPGLGDVLAGAADLESAIQATAIPNLSVLAAGTAANRALPERLATETAARLLREAGERFDLVLVDAPPAIVSGDGVALSNRCDAVMLVARALTEKRGLVARLQAQLADSRAEFLGVVLNAARASAGGYFKRNIRATHEYQNHKAKA
jgi:capsular exopolysaccharide synthesis family protein